MYFSFRKQDQYLPAMTAIAALAAEIRPLDLPSRSCSKLNRDIRVATTDKNPPVIKIP